MARRIPVREMLRLRASGLSATVMARTQPVSKTSVIDTFHAADERGVAWEDVEGMSDAEAYAPLFPERVHDRPVYADPDWDRVHRELARVGVTLKRLHEEYRDGARSKGEPFMSYDRFCKRYREFTVRRQVVSRVGHKAGRIMEVDWAGPTMRLVDPATGEVSTVYLFVACLPFSRMSYVEPTLDMGQDAWLRCHVHAFAYLGGSTPCIVPDNLKSGVKSHPREGEVVLNERSRRSLRERRELRDQAERGKRGWQAALEAIAALRDTVFTDLDELKRAVAERLEEHNARPFAKREGTRRQVFEEQEGPLLRPLPAVPYEVCEWVYGRKVQRNCHVAYRRNYYSVSHLAVGCAIAKAACQRRMRACYIRCPDLEDLWRESRERPGGERKLVRKYAAFQVLVLDEWLLDRPDELFRGFLLELMEARYGARSTVFCTQFRQKDWHARLGGGVHADAIMDRIVHGTAWVEMGELNMRQKLGSEAG